MFKKFCQAEVYATNQPNDYIIYYAKRFAANEAFSKALGTGIHATAAFKDTSTLDDQFGEPYILLSGSAKKTVENMRQQLRKKIVNI